MTCYRNLSAMSAQSDRFLLYTLPNNLVKLRDLYTNLACFQCIFDK